MAAIKISALPANTSPAFGDVFAVAVNSTDTTKGATLGVVRRKPTYSWASLPNAAEFQWQLVIITDDLSDKYPSDTALVYSDGVSWRYAGDGSVVTMEDIPVAQLSMSSTAPLVTLAMVETPTGQAALTLTAPVVANGRGMVVGAATLTTSAGSPSVMPISVPAAVISFNTYTPNGIPAIPATRQMQLASTAPILWELTEPPQGGLAITLTAPIVT